jgi:hypothetical protein
MTQPGETAPTMIIPRGTDIEVDSHGQLSIRAPGNLVIQNSGSYGNLESLSGSIRIDREVEVEAVSVRCADACFVQGSLTAWKVTAKSLLLEDTARANIVLQETERLEIGRDARLVGNFSSEKDLFLLFSRFARQVRSLPFYFERSGPRSELGGEVAEVEEAEEAGGGWRARRPPLRAEATVERGRPAERAGGPGRGARGGGPERDRLPEPLFFAHVLLERDAARKSYGSTSQRALDELVKLLAERDFETLRHTYRTLFSRVVEPAEDARRAADLVAGYFQQG